MDPKKVVLVGDASCGKTSILQVFTKDEFPFGSYMPTLFENDVTELKYNNKSEKLSLWDTSGNEYWEQIRLLRYLNATVVVIVCSVDNQDSLENVMTTWYPEVVKFSPGTPTILVANKTDLGSERKFEFREGQKMAKDIKAFAYLECSALKHRGIQDIFLTALKAIHTGSHCTVL